VLIGDSDRAEGRVHKTRYSTDRPRMGARRKRRDVGISESPCTLEAAPHPGPIPSTGAAVKRGGRLKAPAGLAFTETPGGWIPEGSGWRSIHALRPHSPDGSSLVFAVRPLEPPLVAAHQRGC
jgi:hypothetical protein